MPGFSGGSDSKESACNEADLGLIPGLERSPREGNGNPFQYSGLGNSMDKGAWQATVHPVAKSRTQLSNFHFHSEFTEYHTSVSCPRTPSEVHFGFHHCHQVC